MSGNGGTRDRFKSDHAIEISIFNRPQVRAPKADDIVSRAIEILKVPSRSRTATQIETLKSALHIKFFANLRQEHGEEIVDQSIQKLTHEFYSEGKTVFNIGEKGKSFYIILRGSVGIFVRLPKKVVVQNEEDANPGTKENASSLPKENTSSPTRENPSLPSRENPASPTRPQQQQLEQKQLKQQPSQPQFELTEVNTLRAGSYFGELALLTDALRTATIVCKEDTDFAVLSAADFKGILGAKGQWKVQKDIQFLQSIPIFAMLYRRQISTLIYHFQILNVRRNNIIYREGDETEFIYIIRRGEIKLLKQVEFQVEEDTFNPVDDTKKHKLNFERPIEVAILGPNETFGEEDVYLNTKRQVTAVCVSNEAELFAIGIEDFTKRILCLDEFSAFYEQNCQNKLFSRNQRIEQMISIKDRNKGTLYGKSGLTIMPPSTKNNSPKKARSNGQHRAASPNLRARKASIVKAPKQKGAPIRVFEDFTTLLRDDNNKSNFLITEADLGTSMVHPRQTKFKDDLQLSPIKFDLNDFSRDSPTRGLRTEASSPAKSRPSQSVRSRRQTFSRFEESVISPSPMKFDRSPMRKTIKLEVSTDVGIKSSLLGEIDQSFSRKYFSSKPPPKGFREEEMVNKYLDSKEKVLEIREHAVVSEDTRSINFENALFTKPRRVHGDRYKTPPSHPSREMTLNERMQIHTKRATSTKRENEPRAAANMHMEKLRLKKNFNCFFKMQAKVINHISTEGEFSSYLPTRTNTFPNYYNPLTPDQRHKLDAILKIAPSENDLSMNRDVSSQGTDRPMMMVRALVNSRPVL